MALEGSHIRFALACKEKLSVQDLTPYISGSIYPDSRLATGTSREQTHPHDYRSDPKFKATDFNRGWFTHLLMDELQFKLAGELFPEFGISLGMKQGDPAWIQLTAVKILQDIEDTRDGDVAKHVPALEYIETPNGESPEAMRIYNNEHRAIYAQSTISLDDYRALYMKWQFDPKLIDSLFLSIDVLQKDPHAQEIIPKLFEKIVLRAQGALN